MNILQALDDPALFAPHFQGDTWSAWRVFMAALFGLPMSDAEAELYRHHTGRKTPPESPFTEAALVVGRRGGKSRVLALVAVFLACFRDYAPFLAPGEVATIPIIAADRRQARSIFRFAMGLFDTVPMLRPMVEDATAERIILNNRVIIEIHTASFRVTRGYTFAAVLADETAFWRTDDSAVPDVEIFRAVRPGLASIPGAILLNASSPYARRGVLWNAFRTHYGHDEARVLVWRGTTEEMNPAFDRTIIVAAREDDPAAAASEYDAEFRSDIAAFVAREVIDACIEPDRFELPPVAATRYVAFVDPSGGSADSMTLAIAHLDGTKGLLDAVREVRPPFSPEAVVADFAALLKSYHIHRIRGDRYAGEWPRERFKVHGIQYDLSENPKSDIFRELLPKLNSRQIELLDVPRLAKQFCDLERRTARGGKDSIDHGPAQHDDLANAVAGALLEAMTAGQGVVVTPELLARARDEATRRGTQIGAGFGGAPRGPLCAF